MFKLTYAASLIAGLAALVAAQDSIEGGFVCDYPGTDGYYFSKKLSYWESANESCGPEGTLASVTNRNFFIATDMIRNCIGEDGASWIGTWDYTSADPQVRQCLTLYVDYEANGGGISVDCRSRRYALCRRKPKRSNGPIYISPPYLDSTTSKESSTEVPGNNGVPPPPPPPPPPPQNPSPPQVPALNSGNVVPIPANVLPGGYNVAPIINQDYAHAPQTTYAPPVYPGANGYPVVQHYREESIYIYSSREYDQIV